MVSGLDLLFLDKRMICHMARKVRENLICYAQSSAPHVHLRVFLLRWSWIKLPRVGLRPTTSKLSSTLPPHHWGHQTTQAISIIWIAPQLTDCRDKPVSNFFNNYTRPAAGQLLLGSQLNCCQNSPYLSLMFQACQYLKVRRWSNNLTPLI